RPNAHERSTRGWSQRSVHVCSRLFVDQARACGNVAGLNVGRGAGASRGRTHTGAAIRVAVGAGLVQTNGPTLGAGDQVNRIRVAIERVEDGADDRSTTRRGRSRPIGYPTSDQRRSADPEHDKRDEETTNS